MTPQFTKLQRSIVGSSIWAEPLHTRVVWITLLALCDSDSIARVSPRGLARQANVSIEQCAEAIAALEAPDDDSRDGSTGERIKRVEGGFLIINYDRVVREGARESRKEYMREFMREKRSKEREKKTEEEQREERIRNLEKQGFGAAFPGAAKKN